MISGLNQELEILGRVFHFQTELTSQDNGLAIRTEVFVGGKVVATRDGEVSEEIRGQGEDAIRARMKDQHNQTMVTFVARARRYQDRSGAILVKPPPPEPEALAAEPEVEEEPTPQPAVRAPMPPPSIDATDGAVLGLRIRHFFTELRVRLGGDCLNPSGPPPRDLEARVERAADAFDWMVEAEIFNDIRIDEQVQCHLIREQIDEWRKGSRDRVLAGQVWTEIALFVSYLAEVNSRADLLDFDQRLLLWAIGEIQVRGMDEEILEQLRLLYGRHARLDHLLDATDEVSNGKWTAHLRGVLSLI